jgi:hypothetical protein
MHFFYLDESGCGGANLADGQEPIFVLGGISITDEGWRTTMERFSRAFDDFFDGAQPAGAELHACDLINHTGIFEGYDQEACNALAHRYLDIIAERLHSIHFVAIDKAEMAAALAAAPETFFDQTHPYLLGFNYLVSYIERYVREGLGQSARGIIIMDPIEQYHDQIDVITHYRRYEVVKARRLKWLVEFSYPVDSLRHPMIQVSDLVVFLVRKFLEMDNGYRPDWPPEARIFYASCYAKIIDRVRWKTLIDVAGAEQAAPSALLAAARSTHRNRWRQDYDLPEAAE